MKRSRPYHKLRNYELSFLSDTVLAAHIITLMTTRTGGAKSVRHTAAEG
jgi:hypothetical protein